MSRTITRSTTVFAAIWASRKEYKATACGGTWVREILASDSPTLNRRNESIAQAVHCDAAP